MRTFWKQAGLGSEASAQSHGRRLIGRAVHAAVESLERRQLFATITWTGTASGNWSNPANWSSNTVPGANDDVVINPAGTLTITADGAQSAKTISAPGDDIISLTPGATLNIGGASTIKNLATALQSNVNLSGDLTLNGSASIGHQTTFNGPGKILETGSMTANGILSVKTEMQLTGTYTQTANSLNTDGSASNRIRILSGGVMNITAVYVAPDNNGGGVVVETGGTLNIAASSHNITVNGGTVNAIQDPTYGAASTLSGSMTNATLNVAANAQLYLGNNSSTINVSGDLLGSGAGPTYVQQNSTLNLTADTKINFPNKGFVFRGGSGLTGTGTLTNNGVSGVDGSGFVTISRPFLNYGTFTNGFVTNFGGTSGELRNKSGGLIQGSGNFRRVANTTAPGLFLEAGSTIDANGGGIGFDGGLPLTVTGATFKASNGNGYGFADTIASINGADFQVAGGGLIVINELVDITLAGTIKGTGYTNQVRFVPNPNVKIAAAGATLEMSAGMVNFYNSTISGPGTLTDAGGITLGGTGVLTTELAIKSPSTSIQSFFQVNGTAGKLRILNGGTLDLYGGNATIGGDSTLGLVIDAGGTLTAHGFGGGENTVSVPVNNQGTIGAYSASINLAGPIANVSSSGGVTSLTGGTWYEDGASSFRFGGNVGGGTKVNRVAPGTTINAGGYRVFAIFTPIQDLTINEGSIEITSARDQNGNGLPFGANFTNAGKLFIHAGSIIQTGTFTQTSTGTVGFEIAGTAATAVGQLKSSGIATLAGKAIITPADGYTPALNGSYALQTFASHSGTYTTVQGLNLPAGQALDPVYTNTSFGVNIIGGGSANLAVTAINPPANGVAGQNVTLSYTVTNQGGPTSIGTWTDTIYLSKDGTLDGGDTILAQVTHTGSLGAGGTYTATPTVPMAGVVPGSYHLVIVTDSRGVVADTDRTNNSVASTGTVAVTVPALTPGTALNGTIKAGQSLYYQVTLPAGKTPTFTFTGAVNGAAEIFESLGKVPTLVDFDGGAFNAASTVQRVVGNSTAQATYFILLRGRENAGNGVSFSLVASGVGFDLTSTSVTRGSNAGRITTTLQGSQFSPNTVFSLVSSGGSSRAATSSTFITSSTASATFNLSGLSAGTYSIRATDGANTKTLSNVFTVFASGVGGKLKYTATSPAAVRPPYSGAAVTINYSNVGDADLDAPLFVLTAVNGRLKLLDSGQYISGTYTVQNGKKMAVYELLGISGGAAGTLSPGESGQLNVVFEPIDTTPHSKIDFDVYAPDAASKPLDLGALKSNLRPADLADDAWDAVFSNFTADVGGTVGSYRAMLAQTANYLGQFGSVSGDVTSLLSFELDQAGNFGTLAERYAMGELGRGNTAPYSLRAVTDSNGDVTFTNGQLSRFFYVSGGSYKSLGGDTATVTKSGSIYTLTETNGSKAVFLANGRLNYVQAADGRRITIGYDGNGRISSATDSVTGDTTTYTHNAAGLIATSTDAVGRVTTYGYDAANQHLTSITTAAGTTTLTYNAAHAVTSRTTPDGVTTIYTYDSRGRVISEKTGSGAETVSITHTYPNPGAVTTIDSSNRTTATYRTIGGRVARIVDALGNATTYVYGPDGQLKSIVDPTGLSAGVSSSGGDLVVSSTSRATNAYDFGGSYNRLQSVTSASGDQSTFGYNGTGQLTDALLPDGLGDHYTYDSAGRIKTVTNANGQTATLNYDAKGLLAERVTPDGTTTFTYNAHRKLLTATNADGTTTYTYDAADRLTSVTYPNGKSVTVTYDALGRRDTLTDTSGYLVRYSYDTLGHLSAVRNAANALLIGYAYNGLGQLVTETRGNGASTTYTYDLAGAVATITHRNAANAIVEKFTYSRDSVGRITTVVSNAGTTGYSYNSAGELAGVTLPGGRTITYSYDVEGNRTQVVDSVAGTTNYTANTIDQYSAAGNTTFTYDNAGRMLTSVTGGVTTTYGYSFTGQLISISAPGNTTTFQYDALGNRIGKTVNGVHTDYAIDPAGSGTVIGQYQGATTTNFVNGIGLAAQVSSGVSSYYHFDATGNTAYLSGAAGASVANYSYTPYGEILSQGGASAQPFTFNGRLGVQSDGANLYNMRARTYNAQFGRFMSRDPLGMMGGDTNTYRFALNNPVNVSDPTGLVLPGVALGGIPSAGTTIFGPVAGGLSLPAEGISAFALGSHILPIGAIPTATTAAVGGTTAIGGGAVATELATISGLSAIANQVGQFGGANLPAVYEGVVGTAAINGGAVGTEVVVGGVAAGEVVVGAEATTAATAGGIGCGGLLLPVAAAGAVGFGTGLAIAHAAERFHDAGGIDGLINGPRNPDRTHFSPDFYTRRGGSPLFDELVQDGIDAGLSRDDATLEALSFLRRNGIADPVFNPHPHPSTENVRPADPNNIIGPAGVLADVMPDVIAPGQTRFDGFVTGGNYGYRIEFENKKTASAPAQVVTVTQTLDSDLDLTTFKFTSFGFGDFLVTVPEGSIGSSFSTIVDATAKLGVKVKIDAALNLTTRLLTVTYNSLDPTTNNVPLDPLAGFLPPNVTAPEGDGFLTYQVAAKASVTNGTRIDAKATVVFDTEESLDTPAVHNTIDTAAPTSRIAAIAGSSTSPVALNWSGSDSAGSGVKSYDIFVSDNGGAYSLLLDDTSLTSYSFTGTLGHTYRFYSVATDNVGYVEAVPNTPDAITTIVQGGGGQTGSISGVLWNDSDSDGVFDANESASGVRQVFIDANANGKLDAGEVSVMSNAQGKYTFNNLPAGSYNISRVFPAGYRFSNSPLDYLTVSLAAGQNLANVNIGTTNKPRVTPPPPGGASIAGTVFNDDDKDGIFDTKEKPSGVRQVFIDTNRNGKLDGGEKSVNSDNQGRYKFTNLAAGSYYLTRIFPSGYRLSNNNAGYVAVTLAANQQASGINLGSRTK